ncbi:bacteriocin-like protein [Pedobacter africanus]|uniref:Bacteriocin-like protein n=1 Tax=Pedobacter africanus TaxID=151894 RepID=A0ACC6L4X1_9SPHI|nr:bacteriocin-like protein [Pedobacter africanus]
MPVKNFKTLSKAEMKKVKGGLDCSTVYKLAKTSAIH